MVTLTSVVVGVLFIVGGQITQEMIDAAVNRETTKKVAAAVQGPQSAWVAPEVSGFETEVVSVLSPTSGGMVAHGCRESVQQWRAGCFRTRGLFGIRGRVRDRLEDRQSMRFNRRGARFGCR